MDTEANATRQRTFACSGLPDRAAARAIEAAIHRVDPAAGVAISRAAKLVSVRSHEPAARLEAAIAEAGFRVERTNRQFPGPAGANLPIVGWTLIGAVITPMITFILVLIMIRIDPACGAPGDSGGCDIGLADLTVLSVLPGAALGLLLAVARGLWGRWRRRPAA
jgi:hypothetical protein